MNDVMNYFKSLGIINIYRSIDLMKKAIKFNELNLNGYVVFTEAASGEFIYTPVIAAIAGAKKVYAITNDSIYGKKEDVKKNTMKLAKLCNVEDRIEIVYNKEKISEADIVTNLGFVRPIDKYTIDKMKKNSVIPYMCEAWEVRNGDVDIEYCKKNDITVMGTNENYPGLDVFNFSGSLAIKMLFDAGIEIYKSRIVIISNDKFGKVIYNTLINLTSDVVLLKGICEENYKYLIDVDAIVIADYTSGKCYVGKENSLLTGKRLKELSENVTVIQFAGNVDVNNIKSNGINVYPEHQVGSFRMGKTLAYLGPKPIIDLHCAGLKVGELTHKSDTKSLKNQLLIQKI